MRFHPGLAIGHAYGHIQTEAVVSPSIAMIQSLASKIVRMIWMMEVRVMVMRNMEKTAGMMMSNKWPCIICMGSVVSIWETTN